MSNLEWCIAKLREVALDLREVKHVSQIEHQAAKVGVVLGKLEAMGWQPIESVPKDGSQILAYNAFHGAYTSAWTAEPRGGFRPVEWEGFPCGFSPGAGLGQWFPVPTHWMPLPEAPTTDDLDITPTVHGSGTGED